jgi:hypothetical protein
MLLQIEDAARWWRDTQVASQQLAVLGAGRGKEHHCRCGPEGGRSSAGAAVLQCCRVYCPSDTRTREVRSMQRKHSEQNSPRTEHFPPTECIKDRSTVRSHVTCCRRSRDPNSCIWFSVNRIADLPCITSYLQ